MGGGGGLNILILFSLLFSIFEFNFILQVLDFLKSRGVSKIMY